VKGGVLARLRRRAMAAALQTQQIQAAPAGLLMPRLALLCTPHSALWCLP
jgi:hypothetical protein